MRCASYTRENGLSAPLHEAGADEWVRAEQREPTQPVGAEDAVDLALGCGDVRTTMEHARLNTMLNASSGNGRASTLAARSSSNCSPRAARPGSDAIDRFLACVLGERVVVATERVVQRAELGIATQWMHRPEGADRLFVHRHFVMSRTRSDR